MRETESERKQLILFYELVNGKREENLCFDLAMSVTDSCESCPPKLFLLNNSQLKSKPEPGYT